MEKIKKIINWSELSRTLTGNRTLIRANKYPKKYRDVVSQMIDAIETIIKKYHEEKI